MASLPIAKQAFLLLCIALVILVHHQCLASSRKLAELYQPPPDLLTYHHGAVLRGDIPVSITWYGSFTPAHKSVVSDFLVSLSPPASGQKLHTPSVPEWWGTLNELYLAKAGKKKVARIFLANQISDDECSMGKSLTMAQIKQLAAAMAGANKGGVSLVLTAQDVTVDGFCMSQCGFHGSDKKAKSVYIWVGNSATQCPGQCAWPFHQPIYGPQTPPLVAPNADVGADGMVMSMAALLAGAVTNPYGDGFFQGPKEAPLEAATACPGVYAKGAYPGYAGDLLVDWTTGGSYNANGVHGRRYLLPALFNPTTSECSTLV